MKIRYYLRGLGLGILVTAIFFMISGKPSQTMSDEMIKARAKELGMTESVVLSELSVKEEAVPEAEAIEEPMEEMIETAEDEANAAEDILEEVSSEESSEEVEAAQEEPEKEPEETEEESISGEETVEAQVVVEETVQAASNTEPVMVSVNRGEGSDTVSRRLQEAGLVADAHEYDRYLMANGYDKRIGVGEHSIPAGATWEDIAKILCNMK